MQVLYTPWDGSTAESQRETQLDLEKLMKKGDRFDEFYQSFREELVKYGNRFDHNNDTAEDLFEECHHKISQKLPNLTSDEYPKVMKRSMGNLYTDQLRHKGYLDRCQFPEMFTPKPLMSLEENVCRKEEHMFLRMALNLLSPTDQEILRNDLKPPLITSSFKYQALKRLEKKVIEVIAERQSRNEQLSNLEVKKRK
jgi:DNA-directed RNA polymerase specialized sigma24 family protein